MKQTYFIIGPDIKTDKDYLKELYFKNGHEAEVIGDGINPLDINDYNLNKATDIIISAHGSKALGIHTMQLYSPETETKNIYPTSYILSDIARGTNNKPVNVEIYSCYGMETINDVYTLPIDSILMTPDSSDRPSFSFFYNDIIDKVVSLPDISNPFMKFVVYLLTNPDNNSFVIRLHSDSKIFKSKIDLLEDYSKNGLDGWRNQQIDSFLEFITEIRIEASEAHKAQIDQAITAAQEKELFTQFDLQSYYNNFFIRLASQNKPIEIIQAVFTEIGNTEITVAGITPLWVASYKGNADIVKFLLTKRANKETADKNGNNALHSASRQGHKHIVEMLILDGANIDVKNKDGETPLYLSSVKGKKAVVECLLKHGANKENENNEFFATALCIASQEGKLNIVELLIRYGADVNHQIKYGWSPLLAASSSGHKDIVKMLIKAGANKEFASGNGYTPLLIATERGHQNIVEFFIEQNANINAQTNDGRTALYISICNNHPNIANYLLCQGANPDIGENELGFTPIICATTKGLEDIVKLLIKHGANVNHKLKDGCSSLSCATDLSNLKITKLLLANGAYENIDISYIKSAKIIDELQKYRADPIKYVLEHNDNRDDQIKGINNLLKHEYLSHLHDQLHEAITKITCANILKEMVDDVESKSYVISNKIHDKIMPQTITKSDQPISDNISYKDTIEQESTTKSHSTFTTEQLFYMGSYTGKFLVSPAIRYFNDWLHSKNDEKPFFDYYTDKFSLYNLAHSSIFSINFSLQPNHYSIANKLLIAKIQTDIIFETADISIEYAVSNLAFLANSFASFSIPIMSAQNGIYQDHPLAIGALASIAGDLSKLVYDAVHLGLDFIVGKDMHVSNDGL